MSSLSALPLFPLPRLLLLFTPLLLLLLPRNLVLYLPPHLPPLNLLHLRLHRLPPSSQLRLSSDHFHTKLSHRPQMDGLHCVVPMHIVTF